jgi:hypothetical protein
VSERTQKKIDIDRALEDVEYALRQLTSNLLRVVRGAGNAGYILRQAVAFTKAMDVYWEAAGRYLSSCELGRAVDFTIDEETHPSTGADEVTEQHALQGMIRASLQIVASRLADQRTHASKGESDFFHAYNLLQEHRKLMRIREAVTVDVRGKAASIPKAPKA